MTGDHAPPNRYGAAAPCRLAATPHLSAPPESHSGAVPLDVRTDPSRTSPPNLVPGGTLMPRTASV